VRGVGPRFPSARPPDAPGQGGLHTGTTATGSRRPPSSGRVTGSRHALAGGWSSAGAGRSSGSRAIWRGRGGPCVSARPGWPLLNAGVISGYRR
jgi:hypothetical protein